MIVLDSLSTKEDILQKAAFVVPSDRQLKWQLKELTAFIHFGMNTFTDKEWGDGTENPKWFAPSSLDADQWVTILKEAGFKQIILTAKHHDGFCLWPSAFTSHSVKSSDWKKGTGDVIKELADACVKQKIDLGLYLSPWDRHEPTYGSPAYNEFYKNQLRELLTNYGEISEVWFDGAVGEGPNGKKQVYDWEGFYDLVRNLQPHATIAIQGPDIRWVGTETGYGRETEWSVVPVTDTHTLSHYTIEDNILKPHIVETDDDLASIDKLINAKAVKWFPSEVDVSLRPGWFYHPSQDNEVKSPEKLLDIYFNSIGKNSALLLNVSPDKTGLIPEKDATILKVFYNSVRQIFSNNVAEKAKVASSEFNIQHRSNSVIDGKYKTYWSPDNNSSPYLLFEWNSPIWFNVLALQENIAFGQRVSNFQLEVYENDNWVTKLSGTTIGYKRLLRFPYLKTSKVRLIFSESRAHPFISEVGFYQDIPTVQINPASRPFSDSLIINMTTNSPEAKIYYSQNFTTPSTNTNLYSEPLKLESSSPVLAIAIHPDGSTGFVRDEMYARAKYLVTLATTPDAEFLHDGGVMLCDGIKGSRNRYDKKWLGYNKEDLIANFDLKVPKTIREINIHFMVDSSKNIIFPERIKLYRKESMHGIFELVNEILPRSNSNDIIQTLKWPQSNFKTEYLRLELVNKKNVPLQDSWLFVSEIEIN